MPEKHDRLTGPLRPLELATASVLAGLAVVLTVAGYFLRISGRLQHLPWCRSA